MIRANNLDFIYPGSKVKAVKNLNFEINPGEIFGFLGPSGAGKSTTQKLLIGLLKNYSGTINIMDKPLSEWKYNLYEKIGVSFEFPNHYEKLTGIENLKFFGSLYSVKTRKPIELLEMVGLSEAGKEKVYKYSKGMKMRLNFARALMHNPEIIFLDEPTTGLDPVNAKNIKNIITEKKRENKTIFLTTHDMNVADELCDRVAFIVDGEIKLIDSPRELKIRKGEKKVRVEYKTGDKLNEQLFSLEKLGDNKEFIDLIKNANIQTIHTLEATLEDIFIDVTGRSLR